MAQKANKGEWGEPYVALKLIGDGRLYIADEQGNKNIHEWLNVIDVIRNETLERVVIYHLNKEEATVSIKLNDNEVAVFAVEEFVETAEKLKDEILCKTGIFSVSEDVASFIQKIGFTTLKAKSIDKCDIFITASDPRTSIVRENIGFSIKTYFGKDPTLFNTAKASALIYKLSNMNDEKMEAINSIFDSKGNVSVSERCERLLAYATNPVFTGFPFAQRAKCKAFEENLDLIDPRLEKVFHFVLWRHFFLKDKTRDIPEIINNVIAGNPLSLSRPEVKYPYMIKSFLYAAYCGMTASTLWDGSSQVKGGYISVSAEGEVLANYALESDSFKNYLYNNCYMEYPDTSEGHGFYGFVYKENDDYYFRLNFQIRIHR